MTINPYFTKSVSNENSVGHKKSLFLCLLFSFFIFVQAIGLSPAFSQEAPQKDNPDLFKFRNAFYMPHSVRLQYNTYDCLSFILTKQEENDWNSFFSVITGYDQSVLETRILKDVQTIDEAREMFEENSNRINFEGASIVMVDLQRKDNKFYKLYWVGHRAYPTLKAAQQAISKVKKEVEDSGVSFDDAIQAAEEYSQSFTGAERVAAKETLTGGQKPNFQKEEDYFFNAYDRLNLQGFWGKYPDDEWFVYQSIGETSYRQTNLDERGVKIATGFVFNRLVFRGIKFFGSSIDPYVEADFRFESNERDFNNTIDFGAGLEYRPFRNMKQLDESPLTEWVKSFRIFFEYLKREPVKDVIAFSRDHDIKVGVDYFKEWGIDLPKEGAEDGLFWGEWFGDYHFKKTDFSSGDDFDSFVANSNVKIGVKWPRIPLPKNPINDELVFMPYMLFEHVNTDGTSFFFQNRYFVGAGVRLMPFRSYRFMDSQWVFRTKLFFEYEGVGATQYGKDGPPSSVPDRDYRFGINVSLNRF